MFNTVPVAAREVAADDSIVVNGERVFVTYTTIVDSASVLIRYRKSSSFGRALGEFDMTVNKFITIQKYV